MRRLGSLLIFLLSLSIVLTACGGGGGGGGTTGGGGGGTTTSSVKISGLVGSGTSGSSTTVAGLKKQQTSNVNPVESAKVEIKSYDASGNLIDSAQTATLSNTGGFNASVKTISTGGYITISAVKGGFTRYEKTFTYKTLDDLKNLDIIAEIDPVLTKVVSVFQNWTEPASLEDDTLSIAVVGDRRGRRQIVSGSEIKSATASGGEVIWQLDVSKSLLKQQGTSSLKVEINNYDPSKPSDARRFPSETDVNDIKLVSTGFDFIDIRDDKGNPLKLSSSSLRTAALPQYRVARQISNCSLITCDENTGKDGVQVGFYMVKNGKWNKLGEATLYTSLNSDAGEFDLNDTCTDTTRPYAVVTQADLDFEYNWWNLDYPMGFACGGIKEGCIAGIVNAVKQDSSKEPVKGLYLSLSALTGTGTNFMGATSSGYTKNDGSYKIDFSYTGSLSNPVTTLSYTDPFTWMWSSKDYNKLLDSNKDNKGCYVLDIDIADPYACEVKGKVLKPNGTPAANRLVHVEQTGTWYGERWKRTNDNGEYDIKVLCETEYTLRVGDPKDALAFNVNGTSDTTGSNPGGVAYKEVADSDSLVTMADLKPENQKPTVYAYAWNTSVKEGNVVQLYSWASDPDEDPLTYSWTKTCGTFDNSAAQNPKWTAPTGITTDPTTCDLTVTVNDGQGGSDTKAVSIEVAALENRAPVITSLLVPRSVKAGVPKTLYVSAYDPDGDAIDSYIWSDSCGGIFDTTTSSREPKWTATTPGDCTITVTVTDKPSVKAPKSASDSSTTTVYSNRAPVITNITASPYPLSNVPKKKSTTLYPSAYDPDGDTLSYNWTKTCGEFDNAGVQNPKWTAPDTEATCNLTLTVTDSSGASDTETKTIQAVNTPPVIIAFNVPDTAKLGDTVTLSATATDADGDTLTYTWFIGGIQVGTGPSYTWSPVEQGTYSVEVKVSDGVSIASQSKNVVISGETSVDIIIQYLFKSKKGGK